jgi:hypothetical protein
VKNFASLIFCIENIKTKALLDNICKEANTLEETISVCKEANKTKRP